MPSGVGISLREHPVALIGAPHSSTAICAVVAHKIELNGFVHDCSATTLAPVPLNAKSGLILGDFNISLITSTALSVHLSSPYAIV